MAATDDTATAYTQAKARLEEAEEPTVDLVRMVAVAAGEAARYATDPDKRAAYVDEQAQHMAKLLELGVIG